MRLKFVPLILVLAALSAAAVIVNVRPAPSEVTRVRVAGVSVTPKPTKAPTPSPTDTPTPTAHATAKPAPSHTSGGSIAKGAVQSIIAANWPDPSSLQKALAVASCESVRFRRDVVYGPTVGGAGERGVFQIHPGHFDGRWGVEWLPAAAGVTWADMFDPAANTRAAWHLSKKGRNWGPWTCA